MTTVLVIEDASSLREEILQILDLLGFQGLEAANGTQGVELAQWHLPDVILCDIMLPELDGYEVLQILRHHSETATIPFIFLTAKADRTNVRQGMNLGANDYLTKPFTSEELHQTITARLNQRNIVTLPYIHEMKRIAGQLGQMAHQDPLTGLPNRISLQQQLQEIMRQAKLHQKTVSVLCISIDDAQLTVPEYRAVNDSGRDQAGWDDSGLNDSVLQEIGQRLSTELASGELVARSGRKEFSLVLTSAQTEQAVTQVATTIWQGLMVPYGTRQQPIHIRLSMGATLYPADDGTAAQLLSHAVLAMSWGRTHGRSLCSFYGRTVEDFVSQQQALKIDLSHILQQSQMRSGFESRSEAGLESELQIYYQPQVNLITGRIVGSEALLRWKHPNLGWVPPAVLLPIAEEMGLMLPLEEWILKTVCAQVKIWQNIHILPLRVSVNLSSHPLKQPDFANKVTDILQQFQVSADWLALEFAEAAILEDMQSCTTSLHSLKERGVFLSIDDFGTGYSSLSYLKRLPIDALKIDQSLIQTMLRDDKDRSLVSAIITLSQSLNLRVIAKGVETTEQLNFLRKQGCHAMQGYLFSQPVSAADFEALLHPNDESMNCKDFLDAVG